MFKRKAKTEAPSLEFAPEAERAFQEHYYARNRTPLRVAIMLLAGLSAFVACTSLFDERSLFGALSFAGAAMANIALLRVVLRHEYSPAWQPSVVASSLLVTAAALVSEAASHKNDDAVGALSLCVVAIVAGRALRLQSRWLLLLHLGTAALGLVVLVLARLWPIIPIFGAVSLVVMVLPQLFTRRYEIFERSEFLEHYTLLRERDDERHKREQTEKMLHVLSQAIGGIVHDLGNPLTAVQSGAETLRDFVEAGQADKELVREFAEIITDGAQMLNHLRLSLMEQTRVLEGKPIPVEPKTVSIRSIVEAGARYQKPKFSSGRAVVLSGDEIEVCVDDMKMITVLMNLIGNALKYSDGEVEINWRLDGDSFLVAILDQGRNGRGISQAQAEQLFVPFGRLDTHAEIEGTGLGLLSVKKIVEAHGGEIYIEGFADGTVSSAPFRTAQRACPTLMTPQFRSAFVVACPQQRPATATPIGELPTGELPTEIPTPQTPMLLEDGLATQMATH